MAQYLTHKVQDLVTTCRKWSMRKKKSWIPTNGIRRSMAAFCRSVAGRRLKRFLAPQRDIFGQLTRIKLPWFVDDDADYWNELNNSLTRYLEELELTRERVGLVLETEDRRLSVRMNRTMYRFGIITGIFADEFSDRSAGHQRGRHSVLCEPLWIPDCLSDDGLGGTRAMVVIPTFALGLKVAHVTRVNLIASFTDITRGAYARSV
jgi:hypothetical protein